MALLPPHLASITMAVKEIVQVWDGKEIIRDNVEFLMEPTKKVKFPLSTNTKEIAFALSFSQSSNFLPE